MGDRWERLDLPQWFEDMMARKCGFPKGGLQTHLQQYWQEHVSFSMPEDGMVFFSQGARFAVSKERLHQRTLQEYKDLLSLLSGSNDPCANYMNEWLWYYIMGNAGKAPCAAQDVDVEAPVSAAVRFLSGVSGVSGVSGDADSTGSSTISASSTKSTSSSSADAPAKASNSSGNSTANSTATPSPSPSPTTDGVLNLNLSAMWLLAVAFACWQ